MLIHICVNLFFLPFQQIELCALGRLALCLSTRRFWVLVIDSFNVISNCRLYRNYRSVGNILCLSASLRSLLCWSIWQRVYDCVSLKGRLVLCCPLGFTTLQKHLASNIVAVSRTNYSSTTITAFTPRSTLQRIPSNFTCMFIC